MALALPATAIRADHASQRGKAPARHSTLGSEGMSEHEEVRSRRPEVPELAIATPEDLQRSIDDLMRFNGLASARPVGPLE